MTTIAPEGLGLHHPEIERRLSALSTAEKVALLTGADHWRTASAPAAGLRSILMSDGPVGVRGELWDERRPSVNFPSATVLAATWDPDLAYAYGRALGGEARRRGVQVLLGPTVNIQRSPLAGRHFECFSEDPVLTGALAAALVRGLQSTGVAAAPKHFVANDYETERFTASSEVPADALHEVYLRPFEDTVTDGGAWLVMSAYNAVNGTTASEHPLLTDPLRTAWGFDGVVVSDWGGVRSVRAAATGQDLVMPGPRGPWGDALVQAVEEGSVPLHAVDDKVRRLLLLAARVGALDGVAPAVTQVPDETECVHVARRVAADGTTLLANNGVLPLDAGSLRRVAVLGDPAARARTQGGGSATVLPTRVVSPLDGLREALPGVSVEYACGAVVQEGVAGLPLAQIRHPESGEPGVRVTFRDADGHELHREDRLSTDLVWFGGDAPVLRTTRLDLDLTWVPEHDGEVRLGFAAGAHGVVTVDGETVVEGVGEVRGDHLGASPLAPPSLTGPVRVRAGRSYVVTVRLWLRREALGQAGLLAVRFGTAPDDTPAARLREEAVRLADGSDVAVVVVGTSSDVESEGFDRVDLRLPGEQDALVRAVAATGTPTVVVLASGAPVLTPWRHDVAAILVTSFGGQETGSALADVLLGRVEPGGRLPTTWPGEEEPPVLDTRPVDGRVEYTEGVHVGYRGWLRAGLQPAYPFGHGLGYTRWSVRDLEVTPPTPDADGEVRLRVDNVGDRPGKQVVQVYLAAGPERPVLRLVRSAVVHADAGECRSAAVPLTWRDLARWDDGWTVDPGAVQVLVGTSSVDLPLRAVVVPAGPAPLP
ncbi:glycoside hydrolase family 3 C-terminal domain-containing protein [uncultured Phycicoccus sp.]|uniref:glycoside hydrolase family 3 C-terminal domain-containing protein n=1 Tax=uncultured Phycicoccus sp. TaxID=661422 RepID=UPI002627FB6D|nr:glycoside hydrolase family 3 C-terminal domain-containing protein [uncultured Phycicoccus sp.]